MSEEVTVVEEETTEKVETIEMTVPKTMLEKANKEAADYKKKWKASLDEAGKAQLERDEKDARIKELETESAKLKISTGLLGKGFSEKEVTSITEKIIEGNYDELVAELGNARTNALSNLQKEVDKLQLEATKRPAEGDNGSSRVGAKKVSEMSLDELQKLENESPEELANI